MIVLSILLAAATYPAFDRAMTLKQCAIELAKYKDDPDPASAPYLTADDCLLSKTADYRHFTILAKHADPELNDPLKKCIRDWTAEGLIDWGMAEYCAVDQVDGKRDFDLFRDDARGRARSDILRCAAYWADSEDKIIDWEMVGNCAAKGGIPAGSDAIRS